MLGMFRVMFMGPRRMRESLGHETRDDALRFLAKHSASVVSDVRIVADDGSVERLPARTDAAFYESRMTIATLLAPREDAQVDLVQIDRFQASNIRRLLSSANTGNAMATLRALASRFGVADRSAADVVVRERLQALADRAAV